MLDIKLIREDPEAIRRNLERRQDPEKLELLDALIEEDARWRAATTHVNQLRRRRNEISSQIGKVMREGGDASSLREEASNIPRIITEAEVDRDTHWGKVHEALMRLPNILHESVPYGKDDMDNVEIRRWGVTPEFIFPPKSHAEIAIDLGILDLERSAKVSGAGFYS